MPLRLTALEYLLARLNLLPIPPFDTTGSRYSQSARDRLRTRRLRCIKSTPTNFGNAGRAQH